jgi:PAS domain S-box-containing protein
VGLIPRLRNYLASRTAKFGQAIALGCIVFALAWLSVTLTRQTGHVPAIWPVNAVVLVTLLGNSRRFWPALLGAMLIGNVAAGLAAGIHSTYAVELGLCGVAEVVVCAAGLQRLIGPVLDLRRRSHLWAFAGVCGFGAPLIFATLAMSIIGKAVGVRVFVTWVLSDALGLLVLVPPLLVLRSGLPNTSSRPRKLLADFLALTVLAAIVALVFLQARIPLLFVVPPVLVMVTFQMELAGAALGVLITSAVAVLMTALGYGPQTLLGPDLTREMAAVQVVLLVCAATALPIGATLAERRRDKASLAASEARYRLLADNTTDLITLANPDGTITYVSPSIARLGYEPGDVVGRKALDFVHPADTARAAELMNGRVVSGGGDQVRRDYRLRVKGGDYVWMEGAWTVVRNASDAPTQVVTHYRDVTQRRRLEDELIDARSRAEAAAEAKSEFLANMSHEIRTPLTGVVGFAELLSETPDLTAEASGYVRRISNAGHSLLAVVNDILDFSKLEAGQLALDPQPFDPTAFADEAAEMMSGQAREKNLMFDLTVDPGLPRFVLADSSRLRQVLLNLIGNAVKFTSTGGVSVRASYMPAPTSRLRFEVKDTGPGIAPDQIDRLFKRFSQVDGSISRRYGGTGLGLAICRRLAELMGGRIGVESREGVGSTFWFEIAAPACSPPLPVIAEAPMLTEGRPAKILIVDDLAVNRELVRAMLSPLGHDCAEASSGAEAIELTERAAFDLVLMDLQMPAMDGMTATRAIRASRGPCARVPILALSANVLPQHVAAGAEAGMDDHIAKPIRAAELVTKVHQWLAQESDEGPTAMQST